jgi:hypothetical protein
MLLHARGLMLQLPPIKASTSFHARYADTPRNASDEQFKRSEKLIRIVEL